jgi:hypothetical protein
MSEQRVRRQRRARPKAAPRGMHIRATRMRRRAVRPPKQLAKWTAQQFRPGSKGVERPRHWHRSRVKVRLFRLVAILGGLVLAAIVVRSLLILFGPHDLATRLRSVPFGLNPDDGCDAVSYSCGVVSGLLMTFLTLAFAGGWFFIARMSRARRAYTRLARHRTRELVPTAGTIIGEVVGRDEVCHVIMDDLAQREGRRPHVVLGGVGVGKTAVLFRLTRLLAENGAVPVPIRLRDAPEDLDFAEMAKRRFVEQVAGTTVSDAEAERVWRELVKDDKVVVLADGLEEALSDDSDADGNGNGSAADERERDNRIRLAIRNAGRRRVPLVIASRPHDALVGLDAAVVELEDLGEEAALEYIEEGASTHDPHRLDWVIETAEVTETPLFLQIARLLHAKKLLEHAHSRPTKSNLDTRGVDRASLRVRLLETWTNALIEGHFEPQLPLSSELRGVTVDLLATLACIGLEHDTLEVRFSQMLEHTESGEYRLQGWVDQLDRRVKHANERAVPGAGSLDVDVRREVKLAAGRGLQLNLVEPFGEGVRFPHSILQAYLASRVIGDVIEADPGFLRRALEQPGRELLVALTMFSRSSRGHEGKRRLICDALIDAAMSGRLRTANQIDTLATALQIDCVEATPQHTWIAAQLAQIWPAASEDRTVEDAKLKAVSRFAESARTMTTHKAARERRPAYDVLYRLARCDLSYRVRLAAAQELGAGGDAVLHSLTTPTPPYAAHESYLDPPADGEWRTEARHRDFAMRGWIAPMLVGSAEDRAEEASANLERWLDRVREDAASPRPTFPLSLEVALGQGFKHAANRRPGHPHARVESRGYLREKAKELLETATFWYSRVTLVHALCLWALPDLATQPASGPRERRRNGRRPAADEQRGEHAARQPLRRASDPGALVDHWLESTGGGGEHEFVAEARVLAILALEERRPERYLWIDESGVVTKIGARPPRSDAVRKHNLWIPPSVGWSALDPAAQRLVADVLLLLNLIERDGDPVARERRMRHAAGRKDLPPCLRGERGYLEAASTIGMVETQAPGESCKEECPFNLCPYPPKGTQPQRVELSEAFCRRQQVLIGRFPHVQRRTARWQGALPGELKHFWREMEQRARR